MSDLDDIDPRGNKYRENSDELCDDMPNEGYDYLSFANRDAFNPIEIVYRGKEVHVIVELPQSSAKDMKDLIYGIKEVRGDYVFEITDITAGPVGHYSSKLNYRVKPDEARKPTYVNHVLEIIYPKAEENAREEASNP